jgi:hypothetical protein
VDEVSIAQVAMMRKPSRGLPAESFLGYDGDVTASLRGLDIFPIYEYSDALAKELREKLAQPLGFSDPEDAEALVRGELLPGDLRKDASYLFFHADVEDLGAASSSRSRKIITAHFKYRRRPSGRVPKRMNIHRVDGRTIEWAERLFSGIGAGGVFFVEAELTLPKGEGGRAPTPIPPISVGKAVLKRCGEDYRGNVIVGEVSQYRWLEALDGTTTVWLSYSHVPRAGDIGYWNGEEKRCREHLRQLRS